MPPKGVFNLFYKKNNKIKQEFEHQTRDLGKTWLRFCLF